MSLIKDYFEKTQKHIEDYGELTIVLMQVGAFFEVYGLKMSDNTINGSNIIGFSRICDLNVVDKKASLDSVPIVMAGFKDHLLDKYLKKLQDAGYTIAVYEQDESCARHLTGVYSPGTYFSCDNDYDHITNNTCCVWIETKKRLSKNVSAPLYIYVGASVVDIYTGVTTIMEYSELYIKNPTTFDDLERFISIYKPSETIIISNLLAEDVADIVSFTNIKSKTIHVVSLLEANKEPNNRNTLKALNCEKQVYQTELLNKFYKITDIATFMAVFNDNVYATQSFCYLLDFIYQHNPNLIYKIEEPVIENNNKNLILANHSLKQLNIIDDENYRGKYSSVSKMLNECVTSMGKRRFTHQFLNPVFDEEYLQNEYNITDHLIQNTENSPIVKAILNEITDMSKIMRQICLQKVSPKAIYQLFVSICASKRLYEFAKTDTHLFDYLEKKVPSCGILLDNINSISNYLQNVLNLDECKEIENVHKIEKSFIREGVDANLDLKIKSLMDSQDQLEACRCYLNSIIENYEKGPNARGKTKTKKTIIDSDINNQSKDDETKSYVRIHETEKNNFSLIATDRRCKIVKEVIKAQKSAVLKYKSTFLGEETQFTLALDFQFGKQSSTNNTITTPQIDGLAKNLSTVKISLVDEVARVYQNIVKQLQNFQDELNNIVQFVTYLDLAYAKAFIAVKYNYCKPEIANTNTKKSFVNAISLRHCLIEKIQQSELYIANDICLGLSLGLGSNTEIKTNTNLDGILLYGTNAVGKTSFIKSIGIAVIMAQAGLFVPASAFKFKPYKYIFTRILGNDNLFKGLSTFAVEMSEFRTILRLANENSLVLGDELCSGTENPSAVSIFVAGIQALNAAQCSFIFATHFHEVALFEEIRALHNVGMKHMSVIYDKERDCLVYDRQLKDGRGTNMYGLEVCKSLSLPADFLENAYNIRMKYFAEGKTSVLEQKVSHYNAKHIAKGLCQKCGLAAAVDVHHLQHQKDANDKGFISDDKTTFDKNAAANLVNLCEACHDAIHKDTTGKKYKKTKTSKGVKLLGGM